MMMSRRRRRRHHLFELANDAFLASQNDASSSSGGENEKGRRRRLGEQECASSFLHFFLCVVKMVSNFWFDFIGRGIHFIVRGVLKYESRCLIVSNFSLGLKSPGCSRSQLFT